MHERREGVELFVREWSDLAAQHEKSKEPQYATT